MKRFILSALAATGLLSLGGCVLTPAYQYSGGTDGYYYGQPYADQTVIYGSAGPAYYNDPWYTPYGWGPGVSAGVYYYSDGHRRYRYDGRDHGRYDRHDGGGHRRYDHDGDRHAGYRQDHAPQYRQSNRLGARGVQLMHRQQPQSRSTSSRRSESRSSSNRRRHR